MTCKHTRRRHDGSSLRLAGLPARQRGRHGSASRPGERQIGARGQSLVEFAIVLTVFMLVTVGLIDGLRVIFYYSQIQEAAREGARWGSVQVARAVNGGPSQIPWGTFGYRGNAAGSYCDPYPSLQCPNDGCHYSLS